MQKLYWQRCLEEIIINSWWLILCMLIGGFVYDRALGGLKQEEMRLQKRVLDLQQKILCSENEQEELTLHLKSWDNPAVVESALIRRLGLVPKGYTKVCFSSMKSETVD